MGAQPFSAHPKRLWTEATGMLTTDTVRGQDESLRSRRFHVHEERNFRNDRQLPMD